MEFNFPIVLAMEMLPWLVWGASGALGDGRRASQMVLTSIRGGEKVEPACHPRTVSSRLPRNRAELARKRAITDGHHRKGQASPAAATRSFPISNLPSSIDGSGKRFQQVAKDLASVTDSRCLVQLPTA